MSSFESAVYLLMFYFNILSVAKVQVLTKFVDKAWSLNTRYATQYFN